MLLFFILFYFLIVGLFMYANYFDYVIARILLKGFCGVLFVLIPFLVTKNNKTSRNTKYFKIMLLALICACIGDILLDVDNSNLGILFILGMLFFALTHIMFSIAFFNHIKFNKTSFISFLAILVPTLLTINCFGIINAGDLILVVNIYALIISLMVSLAITLFTKKKLNSYFRYTTLFGIMLFAISDLILMFALFSNSPTKILLLFNNMVYYIAQLLIGFSFYKINLIKHKK